MLDEQDHYLNRSQCPSLGPRGCNVEYFAELDSYEARLNALRSGRGAATRQRIREGKIADLSQCPSLGPRGCNCGRKRGGQVAPGLNALRSGRGAATVYSKGYVQLQWPSQCPSLGPRGCNSQREQLENYWKLRLNALRSGRGAATAMKDVARNFRQRVSMPFARAEGLQQGSQSFRIVRSVVSMPFARAEGLQLVTGYELNPVHNPSQCPSLGPRGCNTPCQASFARPLPVSMPFARAEGLQLGQGGGQQGQDPRLNALRSGRGAATKTY